MNKYFTLSILSVFSIRPIIYGASIGDAIALCGFAALCAYNFYLESIKEQPINESFKKELEDMKSAINSLKISKTYSIR